MKATYCIAFSVWEVYFKIQWVQKKKNPHRWRKVDCKLTEKQDATTKAQNIELYH